MSIIVKLGSSIVAGDDGALRSEVLDLVCRQVAGLERGGESIVMVTSGAIARGIRLRGMEVRPRAIDELQAASAIGQGSLFREYESRLASHGTRAAQVLLTAPDLSARASYLNARRTLQRLLDWEVVPVINENDTTATDEITFGDNDFLAAQVAILLEARLLVLLTDTDGVHSADPRVEPGAPLVREVRSAADLESLSLGDRTSVFGSGGMRSKVAAAGMAAEAGVPGVVCNGTVDGELERAVAGEAVGTRFASREKSASAFKLWLRHAKPAQGRIEVDAGAARALREKGSSLLPVGVTRVTGAFAAGDAVEVIHDGRAIGKGIAECSMAELDGVKGMKSNALAEQPVAGGGPRERPVEVIHRDRFVLT